MRAWPRRFMGCLCALTAHRATSTTWCGCTAVKTRTSNSTKTTNRLYHLMNKISLPQAIKIAEHLCHDDCTDEQSAQAVNALITFVKNMRIDQLIDVSVSAKLETDALIARLTLPKDHHE